MITPLLFLLAVSILLNLGNRQRWDGTPRGYIPDAPPLTFSRAIGRILATMAMLALLVMIGLVWLWSFFGAH